MRTLACFEAMAEGAAAKPSSDEAVVKQTEGRMKATRILSLLAMIAFFGREVVTAAPATPTPGAPSTIASTVDLQVSGIEKRVVEAAEAMPESKFDFSPESLNIPGAEYKGVRSFALQIRHVAASNYALWAPVTGDKIPDDYRGGNGPRTSRPRPRS
jgi:hypothetical protein